MTRKALACAAALGVLLAACSGSAPQAAAAPADLPASQLRIGLSEWKITTDVDRLAAGTVDLTVTNAGSTAHDLRVSFDGVATTTTRLLQPGERERLTIDAPPTTTVALWCTVPGHDAQGMHTTLTTQ